MVPKRRRIDVDATSPRRINVNTTSFLRHVPIRQCSIYRGLTLHSVKRFKGDQGGSFFLLNLILRNIFFFNASKMCCFFLDLVRKSSKEALSLYH